MKSTAFVFSLLFSLSAVGVQAADSGSKPNIVLILADDLGRHDCGFMGGPVKTPNLDKLAGTGTKLDAFYVQPVCSPTRAALMTGRYPMRHGLQVGVVRPWAQYGLPLEERTLPQVLQEAGYETAICGKWHLGHFQKEYLPTRRGFDFQYGHYNGALDYNTHIRDGGFDWHKNDEVCRDEGYSTHLLGAAAAEFVKQNAGKKPFFLYVPFNAVHAPHQVPEKYSAPYTGLKGDRRIYAGMLSAMDEAVGKIVEAVDAAGAMDNTLFLFSSDNGGPAPGRVTDNGPYRAGKGTLYEGGVRVVAFASWKGHVPTGAVNTQPMHIVDLLPTLAKLAGTEPPSKLPLDGRDVWPSIVEGRPSPHDTILLNTTPKTGALRAGDWKLVVKNGVDDPDDAEAAVDTTPGVQLYNLATDPYEKNNLAEKEPARVKELQGKLDQFATQAVPPKIKPKPKGFKTPKVWGE
ncbi:MAG: arylsulfatase [Pirellulales bacterium]